MTMAISVLLGLGLVVWAMMPLFKKMGFWVTLDDQINALEDHKQRVYRNITDLDFDFAMGRLSQEDFDRIRKQFTVEAGKVVQKIETARSGEMKARIDRDLERVMQKQRPLAEKKEKMVKFCTECGAENPAAAKFCQNCGEAFA